MKEKTKNKHKKNENEKIVVTVVAIAIESTKDEIEFDGNRHALDFLNARIVNHVVQRRKQRVIVGCVSTCCCRCLCGFVYF